MLHSGNMEARVLRSKLVINEIFFIMEENSFGPYYFEVLTTLRNALFINSILSNASVWYNLKIEDLKLLERCDANIMIKGLSSIRTTSPVIMYLEMAWTPINFIIKSRRLMYLFHILNENENLMLYKFFRSQSSSPLPGDWALAVKEDLILLQLDHLSFEDIKRINKVEFRKIILEAFKETHFYI